MNERSKLVEARHFLDRMDAERGDHLAFTRELSAFMAAARSVLQYALKQAEVKPGGQQWHDQAMANPLLRFFRDKRDISIHERPVTPVRKMATESASLLNIGDDDEEVMIPYPHMRTVEHYEFRDRPGDNVIDVSRCYLALLYRARFSGHKIDGVDSWERPVRNDAPGCPTIDDLDPARPWVPPC